MIDELKLGSEEIDGCVECDTSFRCIALSSVWGEARRRGPSYSPSLVSGPMRRDKLITIVTFKWVVFPLMEKEQSNVVKVVGHGPSHCWILPIFDELIQRLHQKQTLDQ